MLVGVVKEIKVHANGVPVTPQDVVALLASNHCHRL